MEVAEASLKGGLGVSSTPHEILQIYFLASGISSILTSFLTTGELLVHFGAAK